MLYIMESQLTSLLLKPRRPISCLCMSGRGPHPRTPNHELRTQTQTSWTASSGTSSRRDAIIVRERLAKPGNLEKLSRARARILVGFHDDTTRRRRNAEATRAAHSREPTTRLLSATVKAIFRQSFSLYREYVISGPPSALSTRFSTLRAVICRDSFAKVLRINAWCFSRFGNFLFICFASLLHPSRCFLSHPSSERIFT